MLLAVSMEGNGVHPVVFLEAGCRLPGGGGRPEIECTEGMTATIDPVDHGTE